jgi:hypothetical protein
VILGGGSTAGRRRPKEEGVEGDGAFSTAHLRCGKVKSGQGVAAEWAARGGRPTEEKGRWVGCGPHQERAGVGPSRQARPEW